MIIDLNDHERKMLVRILEKEIQSAEGAVKEARESGIDGMADVLDQGVNIARGILSKCHSR